MKYKYLLLIFLSIFLPMALFFQENLHAQQKGKNRVGVVIEKDSEKNSEKNEKSSKKSKTSEKSKKFSEKSKISEKCEKFRNEKAFVAVPIADLVGDALDLEKNIKYQTYETLPLESKKGTGNCKRINQALFNETVEIIGRKDNQVQVMTLNTFYQDKNGEKIAKYWAKKDNFIYYKDLKKATPKADININLIPKPINWASNNIEKANKNIVTLKAPFYDKITGKTYSAGTRFVKTETSQDIGPNYTQVFIFDPHSFSFKKTEIPIELCAKNTVKNNTTKREEFVEILKNWANIKDECIPQDNPAKKDSPPQENNPVQENVSVQKDSPGQKNNFVQNRFIPYVWGGSSYTLTCNNNEIIKDPELQVYTRPGFNYTPTPGLDCSGLVARVAQICNIPYFYKNTTTAKNNLKKIEQTGGLKNSQALKNENTGDPKNSQDIKSEKPENLKNSQALKIERPGNLKNAQTLKAGDLIIYTGHIIVVSDVANNKIIEARTNEHGCGRVHEVSLSDVFYGVKTYQDLFDLKNRNIGLERIDTSDPEREKIPSFDFYYLM